MPFDRLRESLIAYKTSDSAARAEQLQKLTKDLIPAKQKITNNESKHHALIKLAYTATYLNYAYALRCIEKGGEYFDILIDFKMPEIFQQEAFAELAHYFEFHPRAPQMKLLVPLNHIPPHIWKLFREAQKEHIKHSSTRFNLDELDLDAPMPSEQLYPLPIQMFGHYINYAVDRCNMSATGVFRFAKNPHSGLYTLPGGGMLEVEIADDFDTRLRKMLDEHLEEEHANLYQKATLHYNSISPEQFKQAVQTTVQQQQASLDSSTYEALLAMSNNESLDNTSMLTACINTLQSLTPQTRQTYALKAALQVETFKLTALYEEACQHIKTNTSVVEIEQFGDTRACGGRQISYCFLMQGEPLETWFKTKFDGVGCEMGDDMIGNVTTRLTLLEALRIFDKIRFSHILIALQEQLHCLANGSTQLSIIWDQEQFEATVKAIHTKAESFTQRLREDVSIQTRAEYNEEHKSNRDDMRATTSEEHHEVKKSNSGYRA
jgi:hypothetical protein